MNKEEFMSMADSFREEIGMWRLGIGEEYFDDYSMGCFYDKEDGKWKVYITNERARHHIRLATESEEEAFEELLSMVNFERECQRRYIKRNGG